MNTYWISLPCDLLSSLASFQCSLLHQLHLSSDLGVSKYVYQHSHLDLSGNVRLSVLYDLDFNNPESEEHSPYSVYQSSPHPKLPQKSFPPPNTWETLSESTKQMNIEYNKKVKLNNPTP